MIETPKQIFVLTNIPAPYRIGAWNCLSNFVRGQLKVWFISASESGRSWVVPAEEMTFAWQVLSNDSSPTRLFVETRAAWAMLLQLMQSRPHAIICGGYDSLAAWVCFSWSKIFRRRFVLWLESTGRDERRPGRMRIWLKQFFVGHADGIAAAGTATMEYIKGLGAREEQIFLAPMSTDNEFFARAAGEVLREEEKQKWGYPQRLILYSGRLDEKKGVFTLLRAFARISEELPDVGLLIVGDGPQRHSMENFCAGASLRRVYFLGARQYHQMPSAYALADVLVLPTFSDPWGMVVNEAFACGVPVVVSKVAGACDDLIADGETGFAVNPGDPAELADRILQLLQDPALRSRMSANCRSLIQRYSPEACAQGLLEAVQGVHVQGRGFTRINADQNPYPC